MICYAIVDSLAVFHDVTKLYRTPQEAIDDMRKMCLNSDEFRVVPVAVTICYFN
uniref:Uncharacterized protein n=1 Tax=Dulem virus 129 TaxID=3145606 RepID=A0AAU8B6I2_9VIRU